MRPLRSHTTASKSKTWPGVAAAQLESRVVFSAYPTISSRSLAVVVWALLPPFSFGRGIITPSFQNPPIHIIGVPKPQKFSLYGSGVEVSEITGTRSLSFGRKHRYLLRLVACSGLACRYSESTGTHEGSPRIKWNRRRRDHGC